MNDRFGTAALIGIWATFALDCFSTLNSSPQTTEINADRRADTLMKWVHIGDAAALGGGAVASFISKSWWPIIGAGSVTVILHLLYVHARESGLRNGGTGTED